MSSGPIFPPWRPPPSARGAVAPSSGQRRYYRWQGRAPDVEMRWLRTRWGQLQVWNSDGARMEVRPRYMCVSSCLRLASDDTSLVKDTSPLSVSETWSNLQEWRLLFPEDPGTMNQIPDNSDKAVFIWKQNCVTIKQTTDLNSFISSENKLLLGNMEPVREGPTDPDSGWYRIS